MENGTFDQCIPLPFFVFKDVLHDSLIIIIGFHIRFKCFALVVSVSWPLREAIAFRLRKVRYDSRLITYDDRQQ